MSDNELNKDDATNQEPIDESKRDLMKGAAAGVAATAAATAASRTVHANSFREEGSMAEPFRSRMVRSA